MSILRRYYRSGNVYFVTCVTYNRMCILSEHIDGLWSAVKATRDILPFGLAAWVVLDDHFHAIIAPGPENLSEIMKRIKLRFSAFYRSRHRLTSGRLWQHRFYDHIIRDTEDMHRHIDYIHYNPTKHGYSESPFDYRLSSIHRHARKGTYQPDWGRIKNGGEFGE